MNRPPSESRSLWSQLPFDLLLMVCVTLALFAAVFVPVLNETPLRILLGFLFVCFVPGYVLIAAVYPERVRDSETATGDSSVWHVNRSGGITVTERLLLSVAFSIVIVPVIGYLFDFTPGGIRLAPVLAATGAFTIAITVVAAARRLRIPFDDRFRLAVPTHLSSSVRQFRQSDEINGTVALLLVVAIAFFALSAGYAAVGGSATPGYSELYLLSEDADSLADGNLSTQLAPGESQTVPVGVRNHEGRKVDYTVVVVQQTTETSGNSTVAEDQTRLDRFELTVQSGETGVAERSYTPTEMENSRLVWLLYTDSVPETPSTENAAYSAHLWLADET